MVGQIPCGACDWATVANRMLASARDQCDGPLKKLLRAQALSTAKFDAIRSNGQTVNQQTLLVFAPAVVAALLLVATTYLVHQAKHLQAARCSPPVGQSHHRGRHVMAQGRDEITALMQGPASMQVSLSGIVADSINTASADLMSELVGLV